MNLRQAAQQALEALEERYVGPLRDRAIEALEAALAEPEQAPISLNNGRLTQYPDGSIGFGTLESVGAIGHAPTPREPQTTHWEGCEAVHPECRKPEQEPDGISWLKRDSGYFAAPTPRKPVELTDDEIALIVGECAASAHRYGDFSFARAVIAAYEAKNGITGEQT